MTPPVYKLCPRCRSVAALDAVACATCGHTYRTKIPPVNRTQFMAPAPPLPAPSLPRYRNRTTAALLALFLGGLGAHKFYLGEVGWGVAYVLFCWTFIPALVSLGELVYYVIRSDDEWDRRYNRKWREVREDWYYFRP